MYNVGDIIVQRGRGWNMVYKIIEKITYSSGISLYALQSVKLKYDIIENVSEGYLNLYYIKRNL